jgi:hypothetical protein
MKPRFVFVAGLAVSVSISAASAETPAALPASGGDTASLVSAIAGEPAARRPLARLRNPLCLTVAADDEAFGRIVAERIIDNAGAAGVPLGKAGCTANALVTFSDNAAEQIAARRAEGHKFFRGMSEREIDAALSGRDPAYVFQAVQPTMRIGEGDAVLNDGPMPYWTKESSYLRTPQDLVTTLVVIDQAALPGRTPEQLADYATLRLLAPTGEFAADWARASDTILSLFATPADAPAQMTRADRAYLRSLYSLPRTAFAKEVLEAALIDASGAADERENED